MLELKGINKTFKSKHSEVEAVKNVNINVAKGEIFGIIGSSGAGKSTLIRIINQLEKQDSGEVIIEGESISILGNKELRHKRQKIGMIFQHFNLMWSRNVSKNIEIALEIAKVPKDKRKDRVKELISLVGLEGKESSYPSELSGGQKQRVGIARALANNPKLLLCDEATSALDPDTTNSILDLLEKINEEFNLTIVMITHQMEVIQRICHRVAVMDKGEIIETNSVENIFEHPKSEITKSFVQSIDSRDIEDLQRNLKEMYKTGRILRLTFSPDISDKPILFEIAKSLDVSLNIVSANVSHSKSGPIGVMYLNVNDEDVSNFTNELESRKVEVEVL